MTELLKSIWKYRKFIINSIQRDIVSRFSRSSVGGLWMILHPLVQVSMYAIVLSAVLGAKLETISSDYSYAIYITSGIVAWSLFSGIINSCVSLFIKNANLMKKMVFPKIALPIITLGVNLVNFFFLLIAVVIIFLLLKHFPGPNIFWIIPVTIVLITLALSLGLIAGILNVFVRDVSVVMPIVLQLGFWFTPIIYPVSILPDRFKFWLNFNPMFPVVEAFHDVLAYRNSPDLLSLLSVFIFSLILLFIGFFLFKKASPEMVDVL